MRAAKDATESAASESLDNMVGYHLRRASALFSAHFNQAMVGTGLRQVLFGILSVIDANPGINQGAVGRALGIQRANMVALINELVDARLVDRQMADDDRRAFAFALTKEGRDALKDAMLRIRLHEEQMLIYLSPSQQQTLISLLRRIESLQPGE